MKKYMKTVGITAALAVMIPLSAYAATESSSQSTTTDSTTQVTSTQDAAKPAGHMGRGGRGGFGGGQFISDDVLTLLNLDRAALQEKLAAGSTLEEIATAQGVTKEQLKAVLTAAFDEHQAAEKEQFSTNLDTFISSKQEQRAEGFGKGGFGIGGGQYLSNVATALGVTEDALKEELAAGKTIAAIASEKGVEVATVKSAIENAINAQIDQAVTDGKLTSEEAATKKEQSADRADKIVNGEFGGKGFGGGHGGKRTAAPSTSTDTTTDAASGTSA